MVTVWVVAGAAGAGKSTLGRALARRTGAVLLDLDTLTNPLLDALAEQIAPGGHWNDAARRDLIRPARYATLRAVAADQITVGVDAMVLVAPFTAELRGGPEWQALLDALSPAVPTVGWLDADARLLTARRMGRALDRDAHVRPAASTPTVPHITIDATLPTRAQMELLLARC